MPLLFCLMIRQGVFALAWFAFRSSETSTFVANYMVVVVDNAALLRWQMATVLTRLKLFLPTLQPQGKLKTIPWLRSRLQARGNG